MSTTNMNELLDGFLPLRNASHADVARYSIEIPTRYCECVAALADGRKAELADPRAFVGWSDDGDERSYLFRSGELLIEISATPDADDRDLPVDDGRIALQLKAREQTRMQPEQKPTGPCRKYTAVDGSLFVLC